MGSWWNSLESVTKVKEALELTALVAALVTALAALGIFVVGRKVSALQSVQDNTLQERLKVAEERQRDRRLTDGQRILIKRALEATPNGRIVVISMTNSPEAHRYAEDFDEVLRDVGWTSRVQPIVRLGEGPPPTGIILAMENPRAIPPYINPLFEAIRNAGVSIEAQTAPRLVENEPITLVVGFKP